MKPFNSVFVTALIGALAFLTSACAPVNAPLAKSSNAVETPPNVIVILADDLGYADVGFNGGTEIPTPHIDRIANEGVTFSRGYVSHPTCGPSRAGLLTGRYQARFGFYQNPNNDPADPAAGIPLTEKLIPELIAPAGYYSAVIGKWHMGSHPSLRPQKRGFDEFFGFLTGAHHYFADEFERVDVDKATSNRQLQRAWLRRGDTPVKTSGYITTLFSKEASAFITRNSEQPFFIYLAYNAPHTPLEAPQDYLDRFAHIEDPTRRTFAAMVSAMDDGIGMVLDTLDREGLRDNTIVFFLSDNGGIVIEDGHPDYAFKNKPGDWNGSDNGVLRAGKGTLWEGGVRVPFAMRWPAKIDAGTKHAEPVISLDIVSTMLAAAGKRDKGAFGLDGVDLLAQLNGASSQPRRFLWRQNLTPGKRRYATVTGDQKLFDAEDQPQPYLFDLARDPGEQTDVSEGFRNLIRQEQAAIADWTRDMPETYTVTPSHIRWKNAPARKRP